MDASDVIALCAIVAGFVGVAIPLILGYVQSRREIRRRLEYRIDSLHEAIHLASSHVMTNQPIPQPLVQYLGELSQLSNAFAEDAYEVSRRLQEKAREAERAKAKSPLELWHLLMTALHMRLGLATLGRAELLFASGAIAIAKLALFEDTDDEDEQLLRSLLASPPSDWRNELAAFSGLVTERRWQAMLTGNS